MAMCKNCGSVKSVKNGIVGVGQRYRCKECGCNFREGDRRTNDKVAAKKHYAFFYMQLPKEPIE